MKIQCLQARELELDHSRWKEWVFPPKAKDKIAAPSPLAKFTGSLHTSTVIKTMRAAAQKIWLKDQNTGLFTSEQHDKYCMDSDSSQ